jgi:Putative prokaryotic signal transducing protein
MNSNAEWVDLRCTWLDEAVWFRSALQAAGIEALIPDEHTLGLPLGPDTGPADKGPGTVRLLVRAEDLEHALEVLGANPMPVDR